MSHPPAKGVHAWAAGRALRRAARLRPRTDGGRGSPLHSLAVHLPGGGAKQRGHAPVAVAPVPARRRNDVRRQRRLVIPAPRRRPLRRAVLAQHAGPRAARTPPPSCARARSPDADARGSTVSLRRTFGSRAASAVVAPFAVRTSASRSLPLAASGPCRFRPMIRTFQIRSNIASGPLRWGQATGPGGTTNAERPARAGPRPTRRPPSHDAQPPRPRRPSACPT